jgi:hypothetical protein
LDASAVNQYRLDDSAAHDFSASEPGAHGPLRELVIALVP